MNADDRGFLLDYYREDVKKLERILARDLSQWLK